jgi:hypothetical protein
VKSRPRFRRQALRCPTEETGRCNLARRRFEDEAVAVEIVRRPTGAGGVWSCHGVAGDNRVAVLHQNLRLPERVLVVEAKNPKGHP